MKTLYLRCTLLLALGCCNLAIAGSPDPPAPPPTVSISISGAASSSTVCPGDSFTARANVSNTSTSGLTYEWAIAIGTVNGQNITTTNSNTVTGIVSRPFSGSRSNITVRVFRSGSEIAEDIKPVTVLSNTSPSQPGAISIQNNNPNAPTSVAICQNSGATFSVAAVSGAFQYRWAVNGSTTTTSSRFFSPFFRNTGQQTVSVVAVGCGGSSAARSVTVSVIPSNQSPCDGPQFRLAAEPADKEAVSTYPNPVENGKLQIDVPSEYLASPAQLVNQKTGDIVKSFSIDDVQSEVSTDNLPKGTYLLRVQGSEGTITRRIIIE